MKEEKRRDMWPPDLEYDFSGMTLDKALIMIEAARKKAFQMKLPVTLAVNDGAGNLVAIQRMDDAPLVGLEIAINKVRTAVFGKVPTDQWGPVFKSNESLLTTLWYHSGWITFPGGFPVIIERKIIGAIGCSGGTWEDGVIARAGLLALGADVSGAEAFLRGAGIFPGQW